ncbi:Ger(x)C family spore germination protein [Paenibacillus aurantiacus]|uniref:Ger(X)C family spore germination protein n=1 Tax=Paenibacillus aurantiacus TaxID=1936118 RepID=A0ABV5KRW0_9BACL
MVRRMIAIGDIARRLLAIGALILLTGCWDRIEINDRALVAALYIDYNDDGSYEVSLGFPLPNRLSTGIGAPSSGGNNNPFAVVSKTAPNVPEAIRKIRSDLTREINWGHARIIVFGRRMAEHGIKPVLEMVSREPTFHIKSYIMVAPRKAKDITNLTPVFERFPSEVLREFESMRLIPRTTVKDALESFEFGGDFVTSLLTMGEISMLSERGKVSPWAGTDGAAVFREGKMVGSFDVKEMRAGLWLQDEMQSALITMRAKKDGKPVSFLILRSKATISPRLAAGRLSFTLRVEAQDDVNSSESSVDLTDPAQIKAMEQELSDILRARLERAITHSQKMKVDAFELARHVEWRYPRYWKQIEPDWREIYSKMDVQVEAKVAIKRMGTEKNPVWIKQEK